MNRANRSAAQSALSHVRYARARGRFFNHFNGFSRRIYHPRWMARESILACAFVRELFTRRDAAAAAAAERDANFSSRRRVTAVC